jgi:YgiT-type zinc finger domain-containing protein
MTEQEQVQVSQPCEMCGATAVREMVNHSFDYGRGDAKVTLRTLMPVWHCATCELEYTDAEGEAARLTAAIAKIEGDTK